MNATDLAALGAGFSNGAVGSQAVFRAALNALAHPARVTPVSHDAQVPNVGNAASAALLLALVDADCRVWLSPSLAASDAPAWLRFHTGCTMVDAPAKAHFAWVCADDSLPALNSFALGSHEYPDQSTTCIVDVTGFDVDADMPANWCCVGPGIQTKQVIHVDGIAENFVAQWQANTALFPRGVDVYVASADALLGLPRSTHIQVLTPSTTER